MSYTVIEESFDSLDSLWSQPENGLNWTHVFVLPVWMKVWWQVFGSGAELYLRTVRDGEEVIGVAPLFVRDERASIVGSADVCDYLDFVVVPGREEDFFNILLDDLKGRGISRLYLESLRPDSTVLTNLAGIAKNRQHRINYQREDVSLDLDLPATWDEYLGLLTSKQRHEVRRKLRRLWEAGNLEHRCLEVGREVEDYTEIFLKLFSLSWEEKANFMTPRMQSFFRSLAEAMAEIGLLRFGIVELDNQPVSMTMGFDYGDTHYLYNSAYDPQFNHLSVGLLCKVLCIKESIEKGKKKWDFLKGNETYKYHLGGKEIPLYSCQIDIG
jgi:CelD/BcsL family acetyltransferase involved in cellulose biosynthesis